MNKLLFAVAIIYGFIAAWLIFSWTYIILVGALTGYTFFTGSGELLSSASTLVIATVILLGGATIHGIAAYGIWKKKQWARTLSLVIGGITILLGLLALMGGSLLWCILYSALGIFVLVVFNVNNDVKTQFTK